MMETARAIATSIWFFGILVFALTWGGGLVAPETISIDDSLHAGLNMATVQGLQFGPDIVFTYGPLGFLKSYLVFYEWPARLAVVYGFALHLSLSLSLVWALRRNFGAIISLAVALVAAALMRGDLGAVAVRDDAGVVVLALIWGLAVLGSKPAPSWARPLLLYGGGAFAAIELLAKLNTGLIVLAIVGIAAIAMDGDRRRNLAALGATLAGSLVVLWFASGQGLDDIGSFLSGSFEVISGYSAGARLEYESREYDYFLIPAVLLASAAIAWLSSRELPRGRQVATAAIFAITAFTAYKGGLVSHDEYHMATFFGTMLGVTIAFPLPDRMPVRAGALAATIGLAAAGATASFAGYPLTNPVANVENAARTVATMVDGGRLEAEIAENRAELTEAHALDPASLALLEGHSVHVDPSEASAAWAYDLDWRPLPVFQPYVAWTPGLDETNAEEIASADGPDRILRQNVNALGRFPAYESPAAMIEMLCHFEPLRTTDDWQVLGRVPDRCGEPKPIGETEAAYGEAVPVPAAEPGSLVFARIDGAQASGLERLRSLLARGSERTINFDTGGLPSSAIDGSPHDGFYNFVGATAPDGLLLSAPPEADSPDPFRLAPNASAFAIQLDDGASEDRFTVEFFSMPIRPSAPAKSR